MTAVFKTAVLCISEGLGSCALFIRRGGIKEECCRVLLRQKRSNRKAHISMVRGDDARKDTGPHDIDDVCHFPDAGSLTHRTETFRPTTPDNRMPASSSRSEVPARGQFIFFASFLSCPKIVISGRFFRPEERTRHQMTGLSPTSRYRTSPGRISGNAS